MKIGRSLIAMTLVVAATSLATASRAPANAGVFTGNGQNLRQVTSKTIQLVTVDVVIVFGRGRFLFDGSVSGMDHTEYTCTFVLRNLSDEAAEIQVGFPVDSQFARGPEPADAREWVLEYGFIARDEKTTYHVDFVRREPKGRTDDFGAIFVWKMHFMPRETRTLSVQYRIPMSMGLASTRKDEAAPSGPFAFYTQQLLELSLLEFAGYVTSTGSSWAGNVEAATFTVITERFELYLDRRGFFEEPAAGLSPEEVARTKAMYPVRRPWWFRQITPVGWQAVKGGVQWHYKDFKPKDPIAVRYYLTQIPRLPEEVDAFVDSILKGMGEGQAARAATELGLVRQILLATYGKEPEDDAAKAFVAAQVWYAPRKDFSMAGLSAAQQAVLKALDRRIGETKDRK
jgi:hypothetical protein